MRKILIALLLSMVMCITLIIPTFATEIKSADCTDLPEINAVISDMNGSLDKNKITATLNGKPLSVEEIGVSEGRTEWIVMIDTSQSVRQDYFEAAKTSLKALYNSLGENDVMQVFCFDEEIVQVLNGSESKEDALKKIDAVECVGMETVFYDAVKQIAESSKKSTADSVIPIFFTDGADTLSETSKEEAQNIISSMKTPIYGFYADITDETDAENLTSILSGSKGNTVSYSLTNLTAKLTSIEGRNNTNIRLSIPDSIEANKESLLVIDFGDGNKLTKKIDFKGYTKEVKPTEPATDEPVTGEPAEEKSIFPVIGLTALLILVIIIALIVIRKKNKPSVTEPDPFDTPEIETEEKSKAEKEAQKNIDKQKKEAEKETEKAEKEAEKEAVKEAKKAIKSKSVVITAGKDVKNGKGKNKTDEIAKKRADQKAKEDKKAEKAALKIQEKENKKAEKEFNAEQKKNNSQILFTVAAPSKNTKIKKDAAAEIARKREKQKLAEEKKNKKTAEKEAKKIQKKNEKAEQQKIKRSQSDKYMFYFNNK